MIDDKESFQFITTPAQLNLKESIIERLENGKLVIDISNERTAFLEFYYRSDNPQTEAEIWDHIVSRICSIGGKIIHEKYNENELLITIVLK